MSYKRSRQAFEADLQKQESPFVVYGTPLPPLDEHSRDDGSYVPVWKQEVTDDRGRKRLHGAFTGGFSAGYYNTVGSKEGWAPSTFISSRTNRAKDGKNIKQQKAADFMDEEDIREAEDARNLSTTDAFAGFGTMDDPLHRNTMKDLFIPVDDSMGVKLLNKMGWKQGQGIGPRIKRKAHSEDEDSEVHTFAPEDIPMVSFNKKLDNKGLGYDEEAGSASAGLLPAQTENKHRLQSRSDDEDDDGRPGLSFSTQPKKVQKPKRGGFGVGILNDTGSDEEDPYAMGPKISYNKTLGGEKKSKKKQMTSVGNANPTLKSKPVFVSQKLSTIKNALRKCHDGRLPLQGFSLASELDMFASMSLTDDKYKPPEVPADWTPSRIADKTDGDGDFSSTTRTSDQKTTSVSHTTAMRSKILGETPLPGKSVFDYLTPAARDRLAAATGKQNLPQALGEKLSGTDVLKSNNKPIIPLPFLGSSTAQQALSRSSTGGFMPYSEDLLKRARYKVFLEISAGLKAETDSVLRAQEMNDEDYSNELNEFVRAAEVFKPVSSGLSSRFASSSSTSAPSSSMNTSSSLNTEDLISKPAKKPEDPAEVAAKLGMFGPLTRTVFTFQPTRLVSKRFGIEFIGAMPDMPATSTSTSTPSYSVPQSQHPQYPSNENTPSSNFKSAGYITQGKQEQVEEVNPSSPPATDSSLHHATTNPSTIPNIPSVLSSTTINPDRNEALEEERPGQAVFRAIFGSDDDDDEEDDDD